MAMVAAASFGAPAVAQTTATQAAEALADVLSPPAAAKAAVDQQIAQMRSGLAIRAMLSTNARMRAELAKNSPAVEAGLARMGGLQADALGPLLRERQANSRVAEVAAFVEHFTVAEMQAITAFYRSAAGAKLLAQQGAITNQVAKSNNDKFAARMRAAEQELAPKLDAELRKLFPSLAPSQ